MKLFCAGQTRLGQLGGVLAHELGSCPFPLFSELVEATAAIGDVYALALGAPGSSHPVVETWIDQSGAAPRGDTMAIDLQDSTTTTSFSDNALSAADRAFKLLVTGPSPLSVEGHSIGHGVPQRTIDLGELKALLLGPQAGDELKDAVWAHLVRRSRCDGPAWVIGCVGVAMPGLKNLASRTTHGCPRHAVDDIVSEMVTAFVAQLRRIDLDRPHILPRLLMWARKGALQVRAREFASIEICAEVPDQVAVTAEPFLVLAEAVRCQVITPGEAKLINATRLEGQTVRGYATRSGISADRLYKRRRVAEARLARAIEAGQVSVSGDGPGSNVGA